MIYIIRRIGNNNWYFELERCCFIWGSVSHRAASLSVEFEPFLYWSLQSCTDTACILVHMKFPASQHPYDRWTAKKKTHANTTKRTPCEACVGQGNELDVLKIMCHLPLRRTLLPCTVPRPLSVTCDLHPMLKYVDGNWLCITKTRQTVFLVIVEFCVGGKSITASGKPWNRLHLHA